MIHATFFFNATATTEIYTLSLHDALPIYHMKQLLPLLAALVRTTQRRPIRRYQFGRTVCAESVVPAHDEYLILVMGVQDRKSTRLNSSHPSISYAVFCLKKKKKHLHILYH